MYTRWFRKVRRLFRDLLHTGICLVWIAGLALGIIAGRFYGDDYCGILELAPVCKPSVSGLAVVNVFPVLISAFAVFINSNLLYLLCLLRGTILGLAVFACGSVYGQAGLMMLSLMVFSLLVFSPVMLWYWSGGMDPSKKDFARDTVLCIVIAIIVAVMDDWIIAPFLIEVMNF